MGKYKELLQNIGVLTLGNFGSKILAFFLIPLYTAVLSTEDYGNYDIIHTTITLLFPLLTINITEGAMRFLLDKNADKDTILKKSFAIINISSLIVAILLAINAIFHFIPLFEKYTLFFILYYITNVYYISAQNITRGLDKIKNNAISGVINSILVLGLNLLFLLVFKWGLNGYFLAYIISNGLSAIYLLLVDSITKYALNIKTKNLPDDNGLTKYSKPLMLNSVSWWINDVSDRYFVTGICGAAANGIYSVAYKIPTILSVFQGIFNQAWLISVTKEYKQNNNKDFVKKIYRSYNATLVISCSILMILNKLIASVLYKGDFYEAWRYVPLLLISVVFSASGSAIGVIFGAEKNSKASSFTTVLGAATNIILNAILIPMCGIIGAAIATAVASFVVWLVRWIYCKKYITLDLTHKDITTYALLIAQSMTFFLLDRVILYAVQSVVFILIIVLNADLIKNLFKKATKRIKQ